MPTAIKPALRRAYGNEAWGFAPVIADIEAPTLTELNAAGGLNLACQLFTEQEGVTAETEKVTLPQLMCETSSYEINGQTKFSLADLQISLQPQAEETEDGKKAWVTLTDGIEGFLWYRQDIPSAKELEAGQFVSILPVQMGVKNPTKTATDAAGVYAFTMAGSITGQPAFLKQIVAGA